MNLVPPVACLGCPFAVGEEGQSPQGESRGTGEPGLAEKLVHYAEAVARWIAAGRPTRSDEEVRQVFEDFCQPCDRFDSARGTCRVCGCRARSRGMALVNKIKMATEKCPLGKW